MMTRRRVGGFGWPCVTRRVRRALLTASAATALVLASAIPSVGQPAWTGVVTSQPPGVEAQFSALRLEGDSAGNAFHIWRQADDSAQHNAIRVVRFSETTKTWEWDTVTELSPDGYDPVAGTNSSGDAVAVWTELVTSSGSRLRASRYNSASTNWDPPVTVATAGSVHAPRVVLDATGNAVVSWWERNGSTARARAARYTESAATWAGPVDVTTFGNSSSIVSPALVVDPSGNATAVWVPPLTGAQTPYLVLASRWLSGAPGWSAPETLATVPASAGNSVLPIFAGDVGGDATGNVLAMWAEVSSGGLARTVRWARYANSGGGWSTPQTFSTQDYQAPALVIHPDGNATAVWSRRSNSSDTVYFSVLPAQGSSWSAPAVVYTAARSLQVGQLAVDGAGVVTATWSESGTVSPLARGRTRAARYARGGAWTPPVTLVEAGNTLPGPTSAAVAAESGDVVVLFSDFRSTRWASTGAEDLSAPLELELLTYRDYWGDAHPGSPLVVRWVAPATGLPVTGYRIEAGTTTATDVAVVDVGAVTGVSAVVPSVSRLAVRVRAMNGNTIGPPSNPYFLSIAPGCGGLPAPQMLAASVSAGVVTLTWNNVAYAEHYRLEAGTGPGLADIVSANVNQARFSAPAPPGTYYVRVRAVDACAASAPSNEVVVTVAGVAAPGAPVLHAPVVTGTTVTLTWTAGGGGAATRYTLSASTTPGGAPIVTAPFTATGATFTNVPPGTYYVQLTASNAAGTSPPSAVVTVVVP